MNKIRTDYYLDELTGLPNHKALSKNIKESIEWALSENKSLSLILMDIDDFKKVNSKYGYEIADVVLSKFGNLLKSDSRATDMTFRQHVKGDEFIILAKDTSSQNARLAANRKRELVQNTVFEISEVRDLINITVCCGVVEFNRNSDNAESFLKRAHSAMMSAKSKEGKNQVESRI